MSDSSDAGRIYTGRLSMRRSEEDRWERRHVLLAYSRLAVFLAAIALLWPAFLSHGLSPWWLAAPVLVFLALMVVHENVLRRKRRASVAAAFYRSGLDRLEDRWMGSGPTGSRFLDREHPYARDLDLFGDGSLFQLYCRAHTAAGEEALARWLLSPAEVEAVRRRQESVRELTPALDFREDLAVLGAEGPSRLRSEDLAAWARGTVLLQSRWIRPAAAGLAAFGVAAVALWASGLTRGRLLAIALLLQTGYRLLLHRRMTQVRGRIETTLRDLPLIADLLSRVERESFRSPALRELRQRLDTGGIQPSKRLRRLRVLQDCFEAPRNVLFFPISYLLMWEILFAAALESWRAHHGAAVLGWSAAIGELEALSSLASLAYERPEDVYPELCGSETDRDPGSGGSPEQAVEDRNGDGGGPILAGSGLGHPLLPAALCIRNDLRLDSGHRLWIVSGSNMSGKSTWLRTVGSLVVLSFAGAPVRARSLRLSPLVLGASIRVEDSLQGGVSHFAAEVARMRQIVGLVSTGSPLLFLIDEVLEGTNSRDRRAGTEAVLRTLLVRGAGGLITTHDLALTEMAATLGPGVGNVHFRDRVEGGEMVFDYRIHPGVIERSNALDLMRAAGLEV